MREQYARVKSFFFFYLLREKCLVFEPRYYIANSVYVTMPQAGFESTEARVAT